MLTHSLLVNYWDLPAPRENEIMVSCLHSFTNNELEASCSIEISGSFLVNSCVNR